MMQIDVNNFFFVSQVVPEINTQNNRLINSQIRVFAGNCIYIKFENNFVSGGIKY